MTSSVAVSEEGPGGIERLSLGERLRLCCAFLGTEFTTSFQQIYMLLSLQYLGVPVSLVSVNGMVAGLVALISLPFVGMLVDRGKEPKKRKKMVIIGSLALIVSGHLALVSASLLKIQMSSERRDLWAPDNTTVGPLDRNLTAYVKTATSAQFVDTGSARGRLPAGSERGPVDSGGHTVEAADSSGRQNLAPYEPIELSSKPLSAQDSSSGSSQYTDITHRPTDGLQHKDTTNKSKDSLEHADTSRSNIRITAKPGVSDNTTTHELDSKVTSFSAHTTQTWWTQTFVFVTDLKTPPRDFPIRKDSPTPLDDFHAPTESSTSPEDFPDSPASRNSSTFPKSPIPPDDDSSELPTTAVLAMLGFSCLDTGFDIGGPLLRAYVLDNAPSDSHSRLLIIATLMSATGGTIMSVVGLLDLPILLEQNFHIAGTAAMLLVICGSLCVLVPLTFCCTILTGYLLSKNSLTKQPPGIAHNEAYDPDCEESEFIGGGHAKNTLLQLSSSTDSVSNEPQQEYDEHTRLLGGTRFNKPQREYNEHTNLLGKKPKKSYLTTSPQTPTVEIENHSRPGMVVSAEKETSAQQAAPSLFSKRLLILCVSTFLCLSTNLSFILYIPNALTMGVLDGDPGAVPGTTAYLNYQKGQKAASLGSLVMFITYLLVTATNTKVFQLIGERLYFFLCHIAMVVADVILLVWQTEELYYVAMVTFGVYRTCVFTLPFVLANKYMQEQVERSSRSGCPPVSSSHAGRAMSLMGVQLPLCYLVLSAAMGPLMALTGSAWVPIIISCCTCSLSMLVFSLMYCV